MQNRTKITMLATKKTDYSLKSEPSFIKNDYQYDVVCPLPNGIIGYFAPQQKLMMVDFQKKDGTAIDLPQWTGYIKQMFYFEDDRGSRSVLIVSFFGHDYLVLNLETLFFHRIDRFSVGLIFGQRTHSSFVILSDQQIAMSYQNKVGIWDFKSRAFTELETLSTQKWDIKKLEKLSDGRLLGFTELASDLWTMRMLMIWNPITKKREHDAPVSDCSFIKSLPENQFVLTHKNVMHFWDTIPALKEIGSIKTTSEITSLLCLPDGRVASGHANGQINIWDLPSRKCVLPIRFGLQPILDMQILSDFSFAYRTQTQFFKADIGLNGPLINQHVKHISATLTRLPVALLQIISSYVTDPKTVLLDPKGAKFISRPGFFKRFRKSDKEEKKSDAQLSPFKI